VQVQQLRLQQGQPHAPPLLAPHHMAMYQRGWPRHEAHHYVERARPRPPFHTNRATLNLI
jgi:hypothetical protein